MSLNESIVEDAALAMPAASPIPAFSHREKEWREAIRRLNPAIPSRTTMGDHDRSGLPKLLSGELGVAGGNSPGLPDSSNQRRQKP